MINVTKGIQAYITRVYDERIQLLNEFLETSEETVKRKYYDCSVKIDAIENINMQYLNSILNGNINDDPDDYICNHLIKCILENERDIALAKNYLSEGKFPEEDATDYIYHLEVKVIAIKELLKSIGFKPNITVETVVVREDETTTNSYTN